MGSLRYIPVGIYTILKMTPRMYAFRVWYIVRTTRRESYYAARTVHIVCDSYADASSITLDDIGVYEEAQGTQWYPLEILFYAQLTEDSDDDLCNENVVIGESVPFGEAIA